MNRASARLGTIGAATVLTAAALITPAAASTSGPRPRAGAISWVALGDSYTAGAIKAAGDEFESPRDGCVRTDQSYPEIIRRDFGPVVDLTNVSCGNATIENITTLGQFPIGHQIPGLSDDPDYPFPQVPVQLDAVRPDTDLVTVGVGGNSLGFGEILNTCLELGKDTGNVGTPCKDANTEDELGDQTIEQRLQIVRAEYDRMLTAIHAKAPFAKVITVGYPTIIPNDTSLCTYGSFAGLQYFGTITHGDLNWLRTHVLEPLNTEIQQVTAAHGDRYVDIYTSSQGHSVCDRARGDNWVEGILTTVLPPVPALVHPNAKGQANAAVQVEDAILAG